MTRSSMAHFADEVSKLMPSIMREFLKRQAKEITQGNITFSQILILDILRGKDSMRMGELANSLGVSMAAATGIVDKLVRNGFALRGGSPNDRRIVNISITSQGKRIAEKHNQARMKAIVDIFKNLSEPDRNKYLEILQKINQHLRQAARN